MSDSNGTEATITALPAPVEAVEAVDTTPEPRKSAFPFWDALQAQAGEHGDGILPCGRCGATYDDPVVAGFAHIHDALVRSATLAGWDTDGDGIWCCPACLEAGTSRAVTDWADGPGTETYEQRLALHVAAMAEIDSGLKARTLTRYAPIEATQHSINLRIADARAVLAAVVARHATAETVAA